MAVTILILLFDSHSLQLFSCFPDLSHSCFLHRYFCSVYFLIIAGPRISVLVVLAFPFCPILLDDFIYSWASTTTYIPVTPRSVFLARNLTGIYQSTLIFRCPSTNLPLQSPCFSELAISSPHSFIWEPKLKALFPLSHQSQVILVIPLVTPKAVHFSPSLLFYFRPLSLFLAQIIAKASVESPLWSASRFFFCHKPLPLLALQWNQTAYGLTQCGKCCKRVWDLVGQSCGLWEVKRQGFPKWVGPERWRHLEREWCPLQAPQVKGKTGSKKLMMMAYQQQVKDSEENGLFPTMAT